ncbi:MAG: hypothetical protein IJX81_06370 [Clostridia bacterium]|nr:hypothetical protein [Clostridia bacterium]
MKRNYVMNGISFANPVEIDGDYCRRALAYAIKAGYDHFQWIGPIHNPVKGNIDGMIKLRKYAQFNYEKDMQYVEYNLDVVNEICEKAAKNGLKNYMWHHELDLPTDFGKEYPEVLNGYGDIEVSHPLVKDFLENKIEDFFAEYPYMHGIVLTLHETKVPLLKLRDQKLGKTERVKYVTKILFDTCNRLGKELIVRPFASIEEDYEMMTKAYNEISPKLIIMDKWTQFDWSLTLPNNAFFKKINGNPLFIETDIFGEYFGKGKLPLMLKDHIAEKIAYCEKFNPIGYCSRIDRAGEHPFDTVNEVNLAIMLAHLKGEDVEKAIDEFFLEAYGENGLKVREVMENTEEIQKKLLYLNGYYFHQQSFFPQLNHSKNHFYFEMMKEEPHLESGEWFIPKDWKKADISLLRKEKEEALSMAGLALVKTYALKGLIEPEKYEELVVLFRNLVFACKVWQALLEVFFAYTAYFEGKGTEDGYRYAVNALIEADEEGKKEMGDRYFVTCVVGGDMAQIRNKSALQRKTLDRVGEFVSQINASFAAEKAETERLKSANAVDFVVCGGGYEGHRLQKEVNFSDTVVNERGVCRTAGTLRGTDFSRINTHGWFGYFLKVKPNAENTLKIRLGSIHERTDLCITYAGKTLEVHEETNYAELTIPFTETEGKDELYIRFDRLTGHTPCVYSIEVR